jgi:pSer/pThr/pTyr-binding forkhead associated (FHA) protein
MDPSPLPDQAAGLSEFIPLRLVLQPSGAVVDVDHPDVVIGRHSEADIRLPLPDVSRRHCRLQFVEGGWQVVDLNSLNGVHLNGESVIQAPLEQGDLLRVGGFTFAVDFGALAVDRPTTKHVRSILRTLNRPSDPGRRRAS